MLKQRIITSAIALPLLVAAVWFDRPLPWFTLLAAIVAAIGAIEFYRLVGKAKVAPLTYFGMLMAILLVVCRDADISSMIQPYLDPARIQVLLLTVATIIPLIGLIGRGRENDAFARWAWTLAGIVYIGWLLGYMVALRGMENGRNWVFFTLLATFASDSAAYLIGRTWGHTKLAPAISPGKTWEGAAAGLAGAVIVSLIFLPQRFFGATNPLYLPSLTIVSAMAVGFLVSVFGQCGDLVESLFKRNMGAKDSGVLFPGHGGALDRMDSVVFAGIVVYYFVWLIH